MRKLVKNRQTHLASWIEQSKAAATTRCSTTCDQTHNIVAKNNQHRCCASEGRDAGLQNHAQVTLTMKTETCFLGALSSSLAASTKTKLTVFPNALLSKALISKRSYKLLRQYSQSSINGTLSRTCCLKMTTCFLITRIITGPGDGFKVQDLGFRIQGSLF